MKDHILNHLQTQQEKLHELTALVNAFDAEGLAEANQALQAQVVSLDETNTQLVAQNRTLKHQLQTFMYHERLTLVGGKRRLLDFYYGRTAHAMDDRVTAIEQQYRKALDALRQEAAHGLASQKSILTERINQTQAFVAQELADLRQRNQQGLATVKDQMDSRFQDLETHSLPDSQAVGRRFLAGNLELRVGGKISNIIGILFILFGVAVGLQHANNLLPAPLRAALAYVAGAGFLLAGEWLHQHRRRNYFSVGLTATGVSVLFATTAFAYFGLGLLGMWTALAMCVLTSGVAFSLSLRYQSPVIASFALVGGYLPVFAVMAHSNTLLAGLMGYTLLLSVWAVGLASQKQWPVVTLISFVFSFSATVWLLLWTGWAGRETLWLDVSYLLVLFAMYMGMVLIYPMTKRQQTVSLSRRELGVLIANTLTNCLLMFTVLHDHFRPFEQAGLVTVGYFAAYFGLAKFCGHFFPQDSKLVGFFYFVALSFAILITPMQFGADWLLIGWFMQGVALVTYGVLTQQKGYARGGWVMLALSLAPFGYELEHMLWRGATVRFTLLYTFVSAGLWLLVWVYRKESGQFNHRLHQLGVAGLTYGVVVQTWFYVLYVTQYGIRQVSTSGGLLTMALVLMSYAYGAGIKAIPGLQDKVVPWLSVGIMSLTAVATLGSNAVGLRPLAPMTAVVAVAFNGLSVLAVWDNLRTVRKLSQGLGGADWLALVVSIYAWFVISQLAVVQFQQNINSVWVSGIALLAALLWITYGFKWRNGSMRVFGLAFSFASLAKMVFFDLHFLPQGLRIVSYFVFGVVFMAISFVYQFFTKRWAAHLTDGDSRLQASTGPVSPEISTTDVEEDQPHESQETTQDEQAHPDDSEQ